MTLDEASDQYRTRGIRDLLRPLVGEGETMIYRSAFRWMNDADGHVMSNHFECQDPPQLADDHGYDLVHAFTHVAIVRKAVRT